MLYSSQQVMKVHLYVGASKGSCMHVYISAFRGFFLHVALHELKVVFLINNMINIECVCDCGWVPAGEGGAGTWSDGKLTTKVGRNSDPVRRVLHTLHAFGAPQVRKPCPPPPPPPCPLPLSPLLPLL